MPLNIVATSQTSRFHVDTLTTLSTEVDLKQVNVSIGDHELLVDAHLRLKAGVHYGLVARNGAGKSTLLTAIANKIIPGIADNLRILLVNQIDDSDVRPTFLLSGEEVVGSADLTVIERVVKSDQVKETALAEHQALSRAIESPTIADLSEALAGIKLGRSRKHLEDAKKIALRRSGTRGSEARKALLKAEAMVKEDEERNRNARTDFVEADVSVEANEMMSEIQVTLDALDVGSTESKARSILLGLGFKTEQLDAKFTSLSGGWRSRCSLASALLQKPDLLILDECTNFLDINSVVWLQSYLDSLPCTVLAVAHDRDFLDAATTETIFIRERLLFYSDGPLSDAERVMKQKRNAALKVQASMDRKREAIEQSIEEGRRTAKKTEDENRMRMVKSRQKKLDDRWGNDKNEKGHRFRLHRDRGVFQLTSREVVKVKDLDKPITLPFVNPEPLRFPGALISANGVAFRYSRLAPLALEEFNLTIHPGERLGLVGKNGEGKSTLLKLLVGTLKPTKGTVTHHPRLKLGYYDQLSVEALSKPEFVHLSPVEYFTEQLKSKYQLEMDLGATRAFLGSFGLQGKTATNPISTLSGGQKVRLALALVVYPGPDILVLDEVSTHLDLDTISGLVRGLRQYSGAVILASHDRHVLRCVIEGGPLLSSSGTTEDVEDSDESVHSDDGDGVAKVGKLLMVGPKGKLRQLDCVDTYVRKVERSLLKSEAR